MGKVFTHMTMSLDGFIAAQQAIRLSLVDEVVVSLVPVLFGEGKRYFGELADGHVMLEDPVVVEGKRATHLRYAVRK